nr:MAG TPA: hypothetical protein [Caudoviricetes sp.]
MLSFPSHGAKCHINNILNFLYITCYLCSLFP